MKYKQGTVALLAAMQVGMVWAQSGLPDAGALIQQLPKLEPLNRPSPRIIPEAAPLAAEHAPGARVFVHSIGLVGNTLLSEEQIQPIVRPYLNQTLNLAQLEQAVQAVARLYRENGWVVSAYLPAQDITEGAVRIQIEEAKLGAWHMRAAEGMRGPKALAQAYFDALLLPGQPLNADAVDRAQMLGSEQLGLDVSTTFKKSQTLGATDVEVGLRDKPFLAADLSVDNHGARSTGRERHNALLEWRNPLSGGDIWNLALLHSQGSDSVRLGMGFPVGREGWRVGGSVAHYSYRLVAPEEYASKNVRGSADSVGLEASYPLVRQRQRSLSLVFNADHKAMDNRFNGSVTSRYTAQSASVTLQGRQNDDSLGGGGQTFGLLTLTSGQLNLNGSPSKDSDALGPRTDGAFSKLRTQLSRWQNLAAGWTLLLSHSQQWVNKNLDSSEKFYIGGADSVRAFPVSEAGGAQGRLTSAELRWQIDGAYSLLGFYDNGLVQVNVDNQFSNAPQTNRIRLEGAGLGVQWRPEAPWFVRAVWGRRLQRNPNPGTYGNDQDGTLVRDRIWFSALYSY